ncbi:TylF/MycF/NovP-related O-methyltransferase [Planctomyces sp. SH-PL62]|uniref:TylF/MycF/NovP-related O-methyltransferase n=1 Tax=Planctomyces sp. SH-PL62 TaxID=1636152 RepID=UPI00078CD8E6|nr:TylF/MycF/NovP-related O-methyltransferase [Planctomyces sp. SH-PL62]AMV36119.1 Demethyldecarbamoylnovobiocin O-methyltransferase [Planctomyces sp. SH-PL62]
MATTAKGYLKKLVDWTKNAKRMASLRAEDRKLLERVREQRLTYLTARKLASVATTCRALEAAGTPGVFLEAGCALGGSSILIASLKRPDRPFFVYDVFGMIPPPTEEDTADVHDRYRDIVEGKSLGIAGDEYYGYQENLYDVVLANLRSFGIDPEERSMSLIKGLVQDTLKIDGPVAFAHVDVDWYDPVMTCLRRIYPNLAPGGSIILDDYLDWGGCRKAADEFLRGLSGGFVLDDSASSMKITRVAG